MKRLMAATLFSIVLLITMIAALQLSAQAQGYPGYYAGDGHELRWSGDVDDTTLIELHGFDVRTRDVHGKASINVNTQLFGHLPPGPCRVFIENWDGRGDVQIVREPNPRNNFTAIVRIYDPQPGRGHYDFVLGWGPVSLAPPIRPF